MHSQEEEAAVHSTQTLSPRLGAGWPTHEDVSADPPRTPCREKERNARCDGGMLARSCTERDCGLQRTKNVPPWREEMSSISCPTQWTPCHRARTSAFCRARPKCDLPPSESLLPVPRLVTEKSTIYALAFTFLPPLRTPVLTSLDPSPDSAA